MFCPSCGKPNADIACVCAACGAALPAREAAASLTEGLRFVVPMKTSLWAIVAGYLGLLSPLLVFAPAALITGVVALVMLRKHPGTRGHVRAWLGIVMGLVFSAALAYAVFSR